MAKEKKVKAPKVVEPKEVEVTTPASTEEDADVESAEGKAPASIPAEGRFVLKSFKDGVRGYNQFGQAVTPVTTDPDETRKASKLVARSNTLLRGRREIK